MRPRDYPDAHAEAALLYGQIQSDLAAGRLVCTVDQAFELAALLRHHRSKKSTRPFVLVRALPSELVAQLGEEECQLRLNNAASGLGLAEKTSAEAKIMFLFKALGLEWFGSIVVPVSLAPEDAALQPLGLPAQFLLALNREGVHALHVANVCLLLL